MGLVSRDFHFIIFGFGVANHGLGLCKHIFLKGAPNDVVGELEPALGLRLLNNPTSVGSLVI